MANEHNIEKYRNTTPRTQFQFMNHCWNLHRETVYLTEVKTIQKWVLTKWDSEINTKYVVSFTRTVELKEAETIASGLRNDTNQTTAQITTTEKINY